VCFQQFSSLYYIHSNFHFTRKSNSNGIIIRLYSGKPTHIGVFSCNVDTLETHNPPCSVHGTKNDLFSFLESINYLVKEFHPCSPTGQAPLHREINPPYKKNCN
jgi:hypothetical protein